MKFAKNANFPESAKATFESCGYYISTYKRVLDEAQVLIAGGKNAYDPLVVSYDGALEKAAVAIYGDALQQAGSWTWQTARQFSSLAYYTAGFDRALGRHSNGITRTICEVHAQEVLETLLDSGDWDECLDFVSAISGIRGIPISSEQFQKILDYSISQNSAPMFAQAMLAATDIGANPSMDPLAIPIIAARPEAPDTRILLMEHVDDRSHPTQGVTFYNVASQATGSADPQLIKYHIGCFGNRDWITHPTLEAMAAHIPESLIRKGQPEKNWVLSVNRALSLMETFEVLFSKARRLDDTKLKFPGLGAERAKWNAFLQAKILGNPDVVRTLQQFNPKMPREIGARLVRLKAAALHG